MGAGVFGAALSTKFSLYEIDLRRRRTFFQFDCGLGEVGGLAEVAPIGMIVAQSEDFFTLRGQAEIGVDDGEDAGFGEHGQEAGRDDVDAGEGQWNESRVAIGEWQAGRGEISGFARNDSFWEV